MADPRPAGADGVPVVSGQPVSAHAGPDPAEILVLDTETRGLRPELGETAFAAATCRLSEPNRITVYWLDRPDDVTILVDQLRAAKAILGHNVKFDLRQMIRTLGLPHDFFDQKAVYDTRIRAIHVWPGLHNLHFKGHRGPYSLKCLTRNAQGVPGDEKALKKYLRTEAKAALKGRKVKDLSEQEDADYHAACHDYSRVPHDVLKPYLIGDIVRTVLLWRALDGPSRIMPDGTRRQMELDEALLLPALHMELKGLRVSKADLLAQRQAMQAQLARLRAEIPFNPLSGNAIKEQFGDHAVRLKCYSKVISRTTGLRKLTFDKNSLQKMVMDGVPWAQQLLDFRFAQKRLSTYIEEWLPYAELGRLHCYINVAGPHTGRTSSSEPNLQNIPKDRGGSALRQCIVPDEGQVFVTADWSQMEYWGPAHLAGDEALKHALRATDMHSATATALFGRPIGKDQKQERQAGKVFNFAALFGATDWKLKKQLETDFPGRAWTLPEIAAQLRGWQQRFPVVTCWRSMVTDSAESGTPREDPFGRRHTPIRGKAYAMVNWVVQGFCAGVAKRAMLRACQELDVRMMIHDELICSCRDDPAEIDRVARRLLEIMQNVEGYEFPAEVSVCRLSLADKVKHETAKVA